VAFSKALLPFTQHIVAVSATWGGANAELIPQRWSPPQAARTNVGVGIFSGVIKLLRGPSRRTKFRSTQHYAIRRTSMKTEDLGNSKILNLFFKPAGILMGSRVRKWLMDPVKTLSIADVQPGQTILEVGCGTGFFTIPAAQMVGDQGCILAMDASSGFLKEVYKKLRKANLKNVRVIQRDALNTGLESESVDKVLLFGVIPFPLLPLDKLLPEMYRVLKPGGTMSVWLFPPLVHNWIPNIIIRSKLFESINEQSNVYNYVRR